jgi:hypothetical protein
MKARTFVRFVRLAGLAFVLTWAVAAQGLEPIGVLQRGGLTQAFLERASGMPFHIQKYAPAEVVFLPLVVRAAERNVWKSHGPGGGTMSGLAIDPLTPATLYASVRTSGVFKSTDGGESWSAANTGLTNTDVWPLAIDPLAPATLYAGTYGGGVFKSTDGGDNWSAVNTGLTSATIQALAIDPTIPSTLYAGTLGGVFAIQQIHVYQIVYLPLIVK